MPIDTDPPDDFDTLLIGLESDDFDVLMQSAPKLAQYGESVVPILITFLSNQNRWFGAQQTLIRIGQPAIGPLIATLAVPPINTFACQALFEIGALAVEPLLDQLPRSRDEQTLWSIVALEWIGDNRARPALTALLSNSDPTIRQAAQEALVKLPS